MSVCEASGRLRAGVLTALVLATAHAALPYPHDVICNNGTSHACICYQADNSLREYYSDCEVFMKPNEDIPVVVLQFTGLNLNGHTYNGDPYETQFKTAVSQIISTHCQQHAQECPGTMLPVEPDRVILLSIDCQGANNEQTVVSFVVTQNKNSFQIAPYFILDAGLIVRILTYQQRELSRLVGNMRILMIYPENRIKATVLYPVGTEQDAATQGPVKKASKQNMVIVYVLSAIGCSLCVCYVIAIYKVCVDYHQRRRAEKEKAAEEKDQLNNGQPTAYGAIGEHNNNSNQAKNAAVTMIVTSESFNKPKTTVRKHSSQASIKSSASKRSSASSVASNKSASKRMTHIATVNQHSLDEQPQQQQQDRQRTESGSSPLTVEDTGYYVPEPQPEPEPDVIDNPVAVAAQPDTEAEQPLQQDANGYQYGYYNEEYAGSEQQHYYDNYTYTAEDGTVYYWDGTQWQYMYPEQVAAAAEAAGGEPSIRSTSSASTPPVYSTPPVDTGSVVELGPPPAAPPPPLPSHLAHSQQHTPAHKLPSTMQQAALGKSVSLRSVQRLQKESSVTSSDGAPGAIAPMEPLLESARSATLSDVREKKEETAESDLSSDTDTEEEDEYSPTEVAQAAPATRVVPYRQMPAPLTPMQSLEQSDAANANPPTSTKLNQVQPQAAVRPAPPLPPKAPPPRPAPNKPVEPPAAPHRPPPNKPVEQPPAPAPPRPPPSKPIEQEAPPGKPPLPAEPAFDPFGMRSDESVWAEAAAAAEESSSASVRVQPWRAPEQTPLPAQFALSNEHLVETGVEDEGQQFKMASYDAGERAVCDSEGSSDEATSSDDDGDAQPKDSRTRVRIESEPSEPEAAGMAQLQLASNDYQRLNESSLSVQQNTTTATTTVPSDDDEESLR